MPVTLCFTKDKHKVMEHKIPLETYFAGRGNTLLQGTETAFSEQNHLLQHRLQDRGALPQRQRGSAKGLPAVGNRPDFKVVPAELGVLPVPPNESHLLGQAVFHAWEA